MSPLRVHAVRMGRQARRAVDAARSARLAAVFAQSLHIEADSGFVCAGGPGIGDGPLNAIVETPPDPSWIARAGAPGAAARISEAAIRVGDLTLSFARAASWTPAPWPAPMDRSRVRFALETVSAIVARDAPEDGLARLALLGAPPADPPALIASLAKVAGPRLRSLSGWLRRRVPDGPDGPAHAPPPTDLLGLGPGLTPSGDDVLCGALLALAAAERRGMARDLGEAIAREAPRATTPLSVAFLAAAADGQGGEALHLSIAAILGGRTPELGRRVADLGRLGHTSGWDALAGAVLALRAWADGDEPSSGLLGKCRCEGLVRE